MPPYDAADEPDAVAVIAATLRCLRRDSAMPASYLRATLIALRARALTLRY